MVILSCPAKFHSFNLAEQLNRNHLLKIFYTVYFSPKNKIISIFNKRVDREIINKEAIKTFSYLAPLHKILEPFYRNEIFDKIVASSIIRQDNYKVFIGWSGSSLNSILTAKEKNKIVILERGSSHILHQNKILKEEYKKFSLNFEIDKRIIEKELKEYSLADFISVPSEFVKKSFIEHGISENKIFKNNYGTNFSCVNTNYEGHIFRILYLGSITIRKGLIYLFEALNRLKNNNFEFWIVGSIDSNMRKIFNKYKKENWKYFGFINHYELPDYISKCDVAVQPSIEEGLSMVIPQMLKCGVPVIATTNTGGEDIIENGKNGFIIPIRNPEVIREKIEILMEDKTLLRKMKKNVKGFSKELLSWNIYGERYSNFLKRVL